MTELIDHLQAEIAPDTDLVAAIRKVLEASPGPLTLPKIRSGLPPSLRSLELSTVAEVLRRQVAANVFLSYPKYRSQQERFWDRPMPMHLADLLRTALQEKPLAWSEIRRKLPDYAKLLAEPVLEEQVARGSIHRHPPLGSRTGPRFGLERPDPSPYLRRELTMVFERLEQLGFSRSQLRAGALDLLHEEEWEWAPLSGPETSAPGRPDSSLAPGGGQSASATLSVEQPAYQEAIRKDPDPFADSL